MCAEERLRDYDLEDAVSASCRRAGFRAGTADFAQFAEPKYVYSFPKSPREPYFRVTDYIDTAPPEVLRGFARMMANQVAGKPWRFPRYGEEWMASRQYSQEYQMRYLLRHPSWTDPEGKYQDLERARIRLEDSGMLRYDPSIRLRWSGTAGYAVSSLMRTACLPTALDSPYVSPSTLDYAVLIAVSGAGAGYDCQNLRPSHAGAKAEKRYGARRALEAMKEMRKLGIALPPNREEQKPRLAFSKQTI